MKLLNWTKTKLTASSNDIYHLELEVTKNMIEKYSNYEEMKNLIVAKLVEELYPQVKSELTTTKNMEKLINDLRLKIASEIFKREITR